MTEPRLYKSPVRIGLNYTVEVPAGEFNAAMSEFYTRHELREEVKHRVEQAIRDVMMDYRLGFRLKVSK